MCTCIWGGNSTRTAAYAFHTGAGGHPFTKSPCNSRHTHICVNFGFKFGSPGWCLWIYLFPAVDVRRTYIERVCIFSPYRVRLFRHIVETGSQPQGISPPRALRRQANTGFIYGTSDPLLATRKP